MKDMEYIDLGKVGSEGLKEIRRQVVRLKKMGKTGKEIADIVGLHETLGNELPASGQARPKAESYGHLKVAKRGISSNFKTSESGER